MEDRAQPWPAIGVAGRAVVTDEHDRVPLIRRAPDVYLDAGRWELPGGKMDYGELLADALEREVRDALWSSSTAIRRAVLTTSLPDSPKSSGRIGSVMVGTSAVPRATLSPAGRRCSAGW